MENKHKCNAYLYLVINGEKAAVNNPLFTQKRERTLDMLIKNLLQEYMSEINKVNTYLRMLLVNLFSFNLWSIYLKLYIRQMLCKLNAKFSQNIKIL